MNVSFLTLLSGTALWLEAHAIPLLLLAIAVILVCALFLRVKAAKRTPQDPAEALLLNRIEHGLLNDEFKMYLQFIVNNKSKEIVSAEALSRWETDGGDVVYPGAYLGVMEKHGLIPELDYRMFELVCAKLANWKDTGFGDFTISCNFTRITLSQAEFLDRIAEIVARYDFDRCKLLVEITEDVYEPNRKKALENVFALKEMGFSIAIDDLGSGYSSLVCLCSYPVDYVKIARELLLLADENERGKTMLFGLITLAHQLGLKVVCEGVETEEQNRMIGETDCNYIQGWYYAKALPEGRAEAFAAEYMKNI